MSRRASNDSTKSASSTGNPAVPRKSGKFLKSDSGKECQLQGKITHCLVIVT